MQTEYYINMQDKDCTSYGNGYFFDDLDEARLKAKALLRGDIVLTQIIDCNTQNVVDFYERNVL
jgi:hypothetical protein